MNNLLQHFRDMERRGNITLVQRFGGTAWFSFSYGCNDNEEDNSYDDKTSRTVTYPGD